MVGEARSAWLRAHAIPHRSGTHTCVQHHTHFSFSNEPTSSNRIETRHSSFEILRALTGILIARQPHRRGLGCDGVQAVEGRPYSQPLVGSDLGSPRSERSVMDETAGLVHDKEVEGCHYLILNWTDRYFNTQRHGHATRLDWKT